MDIPIELFLGFIATTVIMIIIGIVRQPQIPALIVFAGMFILTMVVTTDGIILNSFFNDDIENTYHYNVDAFDGAFSVCGNGGGGCVDIRGEYISSTSSELFNKEIDCIDIALRKTGLPTGSATIGVFDHTQAVNNPLIRSFGSIDVSTLTTSTWLWYSFCLPVGQTYTIDNQDVIGIFYDSGDLSNAVQLSLTSFDVFDSSITIHSSKTDLTNVWSNFSSNDQTMRLYLRGIDGDIIQDVYLFTEIPKVIFGLFAVILMLSGALLTKMGGSFG